MTTDARWLGLDVGASKLLGVVLGTDLEVLARRREDTRREDGPDAVVARAADLLRALRDEHGPVAGLGVGFAGLVDAARGVVRSSIMLPGWDQVPLAARLEDALDLSCVVDNDATAAGYGEFVARGAVPGSTLVLLTVGTGIGGAIFLDGRPFGGRSGLAGELGNMSIDWRGEECWCGSRGCLNTLASGSAMAAAAARRRGSDAPVPLAQLARDATAGDETAREVLRDGATALGAGIANVVNVLNPDRVSLCGGVLALGDEWLDVVRAAARDRSFAEAFADVTIDHALLGYDSGAAGAALLARARAEEGRG